jgi:hypothetical protein
MNQITSDIKRSLRKGKKVLTSSRKVDECEPLLSGVKFSPLHVVGIATNTSGGIAYSCVEFQEKQRRRAGDKAAVAIAAAEQRRREAGDRV